MACACAHERVDHEDGTGRCEVCTPVSNVNGGCAKYRELNLELRRVEALERIAAALENVFADGNVLTVQTSGTVYVTEDK